MSLRSHIFAPIMLQMKKAIIIMIPWLLGGESPIIKPILLFTHSGLIKKNQCKISIYQNKYITHSFLTQGTHLHLWLCVISFYTQLPKGIILLCAWSDLYKA